MIDTPLLEQLAERIEGAFMRTGNILSWHDGVEELNILADGIECPEDAFWLLDRMEAAGHRVCLQDRLDNKEYPRAAYTWLVDSEEDRKLGLGKTRTEAICRLYVAVMPVVKG